MSLARKPVDPTDEQLRLALRQLRRPGWPDDLAACLDHPIYGPCIRGLARCLSRAKPTVASAPRAVQAPVPPTPAVGGNRRPGFRPAKAAQGVLPFDARRAAANDIDRDDEN